jgi:hypothetical protein
MQQVEVKVDEVHVRFLEHKDEAYKLNFNIITFQKTFESNFSSTKVPKQDADSSFVAWHYDLKKEHLHLPGIDAPLDAQEGLPSARRRLRAVSPNASFIQEPQEAPYCTVNI